MKLIFPIIAIAIMSAIAQNFLPWWIIAPIAFTMTYMLRLKPFESFLAGFVALFLLWAGMAFFIDRANEHILSQRIALLLHLSQPMLLIVITGLIGGLVAGFAGLSGGLLVKK